MGRGTAVRQYLQAAWAGSNSFLTLEVEPTFLRRGASTRPRQLWAIPFLVDRHCHIPASGTRFGATPTSADRTRRARAMRRRTFIRRAVDMGVAELGAWDKKPAWVTSGLRGLTGSGASDHARLFGTPVRAGGEASAALAQNAAAGAALAKIIATGSGLAPQPDSVRPVIDRRAFDEIAATARRLALPVAVHCHGGDVVEWAAEAGVDSIEHGLYLDRGQLEILRDRGIRLTLTPGAYLSAKRGAIGPVLKALVRDALETGIELGAGTDGAHETMLGQLGILVELGVPFASAIAICAGTSLGDDGPDDSRPLVMFARDPARDVAVLAEPVAVFDPGDGPGPASEQPEAVSA